MKKFPMWLSTLVLLVFVCSPCLFAGSEDASYGTKVYRELGGERLIVVSGGSITITTGGKITLENNGELSLQSGSTITVATGGSFSIADDQFSVGVSTFAVIAGNVGVGTATPGEQFVVNAGTSNILGALKVGNGTPDYALPAEASYNEGTQEVDGMIYADGNVTGDLVGNADTATALAANGSNCGSGYVAIGVDASGAGECSVVLDSLSNGATAAVTSNQLYDHNALTGSSAHGAVSAATASQIVTRDGTGSFAAHTVTAAVSGNATTATALAADGTDAASGYLCEGVDAGGNCEPSVVLDSLSNGATSPVSSNQLFDHDALTGSSAHGAVSAATANQIVVRNAQGNFAVTIVTGALSGNADTATALAANGSNASSGYLCAGVDASGACEPSVVLDSLSNGATSPVTSNQLFDHDALTGSSAHSAVSAATANQLVTRDASGSFAAQTVTATLSGLASTASALAADGSDAASGYLCEGVDASGNCEPSVVLDTLTNGATSPVSSNQLFDHDALSGTSAHSASTQNVANQIMARDASGDVAANVISAEGGMTVTGGLSRIGTGSSFGVASGADDLGVEGDMEVLGTLTIPNAASIRGTLTAGTTGQVYLNTSTPGEMCVSTGTTNAYQWMIGDGSAVCSN